MRTRTALTAALHRGLPAASLGPRVRALAALDARNPHKLERARAGMRLLLERARPGADLDGLARRYLHHFRLQNEIRWHPELCVPQPVRGLKHLSSITGAALVHVVHHGPFLLVGPAAAQSGRDIEVLADRGLCAPDRTPWQAQSHAVASRDCTLFSAEEGTRGVRERLARGAVVAGATDVPGHTRVEFLGQQLLGSSGLVRAAYDCGAPVVPATVGRDERGEPVFTFHEPLVPADHDSCEALHQALLRVHEEPVLAWPEAYYDPLTKWHHVETASLV